MIEVEYKFKKGYEELYNITDRIFQKEINMDKIKKGLYRTKANCNISTALCDTVDRITDLFESKDFYDATEYCYHKVDNEVEEMKECYVEIF